MLIYLLVIIGGVILDQLSKLYAVYVVAKVSTIPIIPKVFHLTYIENDGMSFGLLSGQQTLLVIVTVVAIVLFGILLFKTPKTKGKQLENIAMSLVISGAIGNLIDRIRLGYVVDFFDFRLIGFAIFNIADIFVVVGCILFALALLGILPLKKKAAPKPQQAIKQKNNPDVIKNKVPLTTVHKSKAAQTTKHIQKPSNSSKQIVSAKSSSKSGTSRQANAKVQTGSHSDPNLSNQGGYPQLDPNSFKPTPLDWHD